MRVTPQRQVVFDLLARSPSHPTVEAVHQAVAELLPTVSLRTVYQALHDLEELGEIRLAPLGGGSLRVDVRTDHHAHVLCETCGEVRDVDVDLADLVLPTAQQQGFTVDRTDVVFAGACGPCREAQPSG